MKKLFLAAGLALFGLGYLGFRSRRHEYPYDADLMA
jgi:LPXTG-motif cell wall-anchored protein